MAGAKQMPSDGEEVANDAVDGEEPLGLRHGFEAPHVCLTTARGLMRDFGPVVGIASASWPSNGASAPFRRRVLAPAR